MEKACSSSSENNSKFSICKSHDSLETDKNDSKSRSSKQNSENNSYE